MVFASICEHASSAFIFASIVLRQVIWLTSSKQDNRRKARKHVKILSRLNHSQKLTANYAFLFNMAF